MRQLAERAGLPADVMNIVTAVRAQEVGQVLSAHTDVRTISFTGSTEVGKILMRQCADTVRKLSFEMGGNSPFIFFKDADLDAAVNCVVTTKFRNAGQACVAINRNYVQEPMREKFSRKLAEAMGAPTVGSGCEDGVRIGPLINAVAVDKVERLVIDAVEEAVQVVMAARRTSAAAFSTSPPS